MTPCGPSSPARRPSFACAGQDRRHRSGEVFHRPVAPPALPSTTLPRQPLWPPGRHRRARHRGGLRADLPSHRSAGPRPGDGRAHARSSPRPLPGQVGRPAGPGLGRGPVPVATRPGRRSGGHRPAPEGRPGPRRVVDEAPGRRVPRCIDGSEWAVRAVLGQQVSTRAARTHTTRLVRLRDRR